MSIVVPTRDRAATLVDTLRALVRQDYPSDRLEIIVVDNASGDDTEAVVQSARSTSPFAIHYLRKDNQGPAAARNVGIAHATGEVVGFTDSDCTMDPGWVRGAAGHFASGAGLVSGPVRPVINPRRVPGFFYHQTDHHHPNTLYPTA
ncbi:MAG: glycosyltransferase, partial [Candidatus Dormibacteraceae bacterium]